MVGVGKPARLALNVMEFHQVQLVVLEPDSTNTATGSSAKVAVRWCLSASGALQPSVRPQ